MRKFKFEEETPLEKKVMISIRIPPDLEKRLNKAVDSIEGSKKGRGSKFSMLIRRMMEHCLKDMGF